MEPAELGLHRECINYLPVAVINTMDKATYKRKGLQGGGAVRL